MASSRPSDYAGGQLDQVDPPSKEIRQPELGVLGWARWFWRQLTSMRTALLLLLLLAVAAVPGSVYPQRSADPNGVTAFFKQNVSLAPILDKLQLFDVYSSVWFSSIYILLFASLIGCVVPRSIVHAKALAAKPVATPKNLERMPAHLAAKLKDSKKGLARREALLGNAAAILKRQGYRVAVDGQSVSAERGYLRETGNLIFHLSLIGVLVAVGLGGGFSYSGQRVLVEGDTFVNNLASYDSFSPGVFFDQRQLKTFSMTLDKFQVSYDIKNKTNLNTPLDFKATVSTRLSPFAKAKTTVIRVNEPLEAPNANVYLTGNGFAPVITIRDSNGDISYQGPTAFLPQDANLTSLGVIKVPDAKPDQFGILAFFYPWVGTLKSGALTSISPLPLDSRLTMNVYAGNLGLNDGDPKNVFSLNLHGLKQLTGGKTKVESIKLKLGESAQLPNGMGSVSFDSLRRFASLDIDYNPGQIYVLIFALLALGGLMVSLLIPRRRVWVKLNDDGYELAALARGDDPVLQRVIEELNEKLKNGKND